MTVNYLKTLERRADELEAQLKGDPRYAELEALKAAIEAHKRSSKPSEVSKSAVPDETRQPRRIIPRGWEAAVKVTPSGPVLKPEPIQSRGKVLVEAAIKILNAERRYMKSSELVETLTASGHDLSSQKSTPQAYLSAFLSGSKEVENVKGHGYGLRVWNDLGDVMGVDMDAVRAATGVS